MSSSPGTLVIEPWDKALVNAIVKAVTASDLGITPNSDGIVVRLPFPAPTEERRRELVKECRELAVNAIVKAVTASDLGITPNSDGIVVRLPFPAPTEERRRELVKECRELAEHAKIAIRNIRRDANNKLERDEELTEDDVSTPRSPFATFVATLITSSSAMRSSPRTTFVASRQRSRRRPMNMSLVSRSF